MARRRFDHVRPTDPDEERGGRPDDFTDLFRRLNDSLARLIETFTQDIETRQFRDRIDTAGGSRQPQSGRQSQFQPPPGSGKSEKDVSVYNKALESRSVPEAIDRLAEVMRQLLDEFQRVHPKEPDEDAQKFMHVGRSPRDAIGTLGTLPAGGASTRGLMGVGSGGAGVPGGGAGGAAAGAAAGGGAAAGVYAGLAIVATQALGFVFGKIISSFNDLVKAGTGLQNTVTALVGAFTHSIQSFVEVADPGRAFLFTLAVRDLMGSIGQLLIPAMEAATQIVRMFADNVTSMGGGTRRVVSAVAVAAGVATAAAVAFAALGAAIILAGGPITMLAAAFGSAAGGLAFFSVMDETGKTMKALGSIFESFMVVVNAVGDVLYDEAMSLLPVVRELALLVAQTSLALAGLLLPVVREMLNGGIKITAAIATVLGELIGALREFLEGLTGIDTNLELKNKGKGTGAAASSATFQSAESYAQAAYRSAYSLGQTDEKTATNEFRNNLIVLVRDVREFCREIRDAVTTVGNFGRGLIDEVTPRSRGGEPGLGFGDWMLGIVSPIMSPRLIEKILE